MVAGKPPRLRTGMEARRNFFRQHSRRRKIERCFCARGKGHAGVLRRLTVRMGMRVGCLGLVDQQVHHLTETVL